jgi:hypothetical protein
MQRGGRLRSATTQLGLLHDNARTAMRFHRGSRGQVQPLPCCKTGIGLPADKGARLPRIDRAQIALLHLCPQDATKALVSHFRPRAQANGAAASHRTSVRTYQVPRLWSADRYARS